MKKNILFILILALSTAQTYAEPGDSTEVLESIFQETEAKVQVNLDEFAKTNNYELLLEARELTASLTPPVGTEKNLVKFDEDPLRLKLKVLLAIEQAKDSQYDPDAPENIVYMNIMPPTGGGMAGMDPAAIKDPKARKEYEEAIEENNRRNEKAKRELYLSRGVDYAVLDIWSFIRNLPNDSTKKSAFAITESLVTDKEILNRLQSEEMPGLTR